MYRVLRFGIYFRIYIKMKNTSFFKRIALLIILQILVYNQSHINAQNSCYDKVSFQSKPGYFNLYSNNDISPLLIDESDYKGVESVAQWFMNDLKMITGERPQLFKGKLPRNSTIILIGTIGKNRWIDQLISERKLDISQIKGQWEASISQVIQNPFPGIEKALVLVGSDKRGTIYSMLNLTREMGVSPWYWWADVPVEKQDALFINPEITIQKGPKVKYRGIFLNDEEPALGGWAREKFGGFNHQFYEHVFELILRLRGNFMWPAMWGKAFFDDDPENGRLANELGIVMSTSHHEPMGRAQAEWHKYGTGSWDYSKNKTVLDDFWRKGMERNKNYETIVTVGMRGDGDEAMTEGTNIQLLENIVKNQRKIITQVTGENPEKTPQVWALYKEVQEYYDKGMRVPDDVTLLLCDDNWGNVRKLPEINAKEHKGGYGMYYHVDYVGGPRCYKWINVSQIQRIWEQMNLTWSHGVDRIWILNVGDLKPMEYPISFFLDMAWDPTQYNSKNLYQHTVNWCNEQFGASYADEAARILNTYTKYNHRITPELLNSKTFSLENYNEFERVYQDYKNLTLDALRLYNFIPNAYKDAFDQLILFPTNATCNLYEMYYAQAKNHQLAKENNHEANYWAEEVKKCFERDSLFTVHYNKQISYGKWNHQMDQVRTGYNSWAEPKKRIMPEVIKVEETKIPKSESAFQEADGYVSIEAPNFQYAKNSEKIKWEIIQDLGKTDSAISTYPANVYPTKTDSVFVEYAINFSTTGTFEVAILVSPTLTFNQNKGLRYAVSFDGGTEQIININKGFNPWDMRKWQANRINSTVSNHQIKTPGIHMLRIRVLESGIVLQKILIDTGGLKPSYLGAPQSKQIIIK